MAIKGQKINIETVIGIKIGVIEVEEEEEEITTIRVIRVAEMAIITIEENLEIIVEGEEETTSSIKESHPSQEREIEQIRSPPKKSLPPTFTLPYSATSTV